MRLSCILSFSVGCVVGFYVSYRSFLLAERVSSQQLPSEKTAQIQLSCNDTVTVMSNDATAADDETTTSVLSHNRPPLRLCTVPQLDLGNGLVQDLFYQCAGLEYYKFGQRLVQLNDKLSNATTMTWGRRPHPLPAHKSMFVLGNSQTRQLLEAFVCQFREQIDDGMLRDHQNTGFVRFQNNATIHWLINNWVQYARDNWTDYAFQEMLEPRRPIHSFDVFVLGHQNKYEPGSNYFLDMLEKRQLHPNVMDVDRIPINLTTVAQHYISNKTLLIGASMFVTNGEDLYRQFQKEQKALHRDRLELLNGRAHSAFLKECGAQTKMDLNYCTTGEPGSHNIHRCAGPYGGQPDASAWDLSELIYKHL